MKTLGRDERGNALIIMAGALIPLVIAVGIGVDLARTYTAKSRLQTACDAGALAARQSMQGTSWTNDDQSEAYKFFAFNFPNSSYGVTNLQRSFQQSSSEPAEVVGRASASIPTVIMKMFGYNSLNIDVSCDAKRDLGHNDIMLVLDATGSMLMNDGSKDRIDHLRSGASVLYNVLGNERNSKTRFAIVPYSQTVNVGGLLADEHIRTTQEVLQYDTRSKNYSLVNQGIDKSYFGSKAKFRFSAEACIEERSSIPNNGTVATALKPSILNTVNAYDIDMFSTNRADNSLQFGRYDPFSQGALATTANDMYRLYLSYASSTAKDATYGCVAPASQLTEYQTKTAYDNAVKRATERNIQVTTPTGGSKSVRNVVGYTFHDIGMLWGLRLMSRDGNWSGLHIAQIDGVPVKQHIVFMTDGELQIDSRAYSAYGDSTQRNYATVGSNIASRHTARFTSICNLAKAKGIIVWVIAVQVSNSQILKSCASTEAHFYGSNGQDLDEVFKKIGQGIGNLRLTR